MAKMHIKRYSTSLIIRETQIKSTVRYHFTPVRVDIKNSADNKCLEGIERRETSYTVGGNVKWYNHYGEDNEVFFKN